MLRRWTLVTLVVAVAVVPATVAGVHAGNEAPLADAGLDQRVELGTTVLLDATGSRDPDGELTSVEWRIETPEGGIVVPQCPTCGRTQFLPTRVGTYVVTVTVTDDDGVRSSDTLFVTVEGTTGGTESGGSSTSDPGELSSPILSSPDGDPVVNPLGPDPRPSGTACEGGQCVASPTVEPWVEIRGPKRVASGERADFALSYGGFDAEPQFGWSIGADGTRGEEVWRAPGDETIYVTAATDTQVARDSHVVRVTENRKPKVDIRTPDSLHAGQTVTLSADVSDPDGRVVSVEWENGPRTTVPDGNDETEIAVKATDDDDSEAIDSVILVSDGIKPGPRSGKSSLHTVYCYYNQESERQRQAPDHCEVKNSDNSPDGDGYQSLTGNVDRMLESSNYNIIWKKTEREISQHSGDIADDRGVRMPDVVDNDGSTEAIPTLSETQRDAITGDAVGTSSQSFTISDKTVTNDLDGDGEINAADWDERFGSDDHSVSDSRRDAIQELKDAQRATDQANGSGGPQAWATDDTSDDESTDGGIESSPLTSSDDRASGTGTPDDAVSGQSDSLGGFRPDDLDITDPTAAHVTEKSSDIAESGIDEGVY